MVSHRKEGSLGYWMYSPGGGEGGGGKLLQELVSK